MREACVYVSRRDVFIEEEEEEEEKTKTLLELFNLTLLFKLCFFFVFH